MAGLPLLPTGNQQMDLWQQRAKSQLDPILSNQLVQGVLVSNQALAPGVNQISHGLGSTPVGWFLTDINGPAQVYRSAAFNSTTLSLTSTASASLTISLWVF